MGLDLVMGDIDRGGADAVVQFAQLRTITSRNSASSVPSGSSIRKHFGRRTMARPSATRWRSPPASPRPTCRECGRSAGASPRLLHRRLISAPRHALREQREADILAHIHMRVEREELEHEGECRARGAPEGHVLATEPDGAAGGQFEPGNHAQRRCLAAAGGAEQRQELAILHREGGIAHRDELAEGLVQMNRLGSPPSRILRELDTILNMNVPPAG